MGKSFSKSEGAQVLWDNLEVTIGALATVSAAIVSSRIDTAKEMGFRILRTDYWAFWRGFTAGEGPLIFGMTAGQSAGNVALAIQADPAGSGPEVLTGRLQANFPVFPLGLMTAEDAAQLMVTKEGTFNMRWSIPEGSSMNWWVFNPSGSTFTTGSTLKIIAKHFGVWLKD